jgi:hypothetical protein
MRIPFWLFMVSLLAWPALAQEPVAAGNWQVMLAGKFSLRVNSGDKEVRRVAKPMVMTADGHEAEIRVGGLKLHEDPGDKEKFDFVLSVVPNVQGEGPSQRVRLKLKLSVERAGKGPLRQSCTVTAMPGESVEFSLEAPETKEEFQVELTAWVLDRNQTFKGWDAAGKPIFIRSN